jgi:uncharacterized protein involved in exopolysaccharide biosynthesis
MVARDPNQVMAQDPAAEGEDEGIDLERVKEIAGFIFRAPRRRPFLAASTFVVVAALGITASITMPRTYQAQVKLLAQQNLVVPALSNPGRQVPREADNPTKNLSDQILRRDNLVSLAKETDLPKRYYATRSAALKFKDSIIGGNLTDEDKLDIVVATLEHNVTVTVEDNNVILKVDWYDKQLTYDLVTTIQKNFQSARYDSDVAMITDAISVLEEHEKTEAEAVDAALEEYRKVALKPPVKPVASAPSVTMVRVPRTAPSSVATAAIDPDLSAQLEAKRQQIRAIEGAHQRQIDAVRTQLAQAQLTLTPQHPTVIALQQQLDALSTPDPALAQLKADERALMGQIAPPVAPAGSRSSVVMMPVPGGAEVPPPMIRPDEDPAARLAGAKLEGAIHRYQDAVSRIDSANMELEIARTAFKYRYTVVTPAEVPRSPKKATARTVGIVSVIGAILLAFLLAALADMGSGRVLEEWQIRRRLKLDVLGEFDGDVPQLPGHQ